MFLNKVAVYFIDAITVIICATSVIMGEFFANFVFSVQFASSFHHE